MNRDYHRHKGGRTKVVHPWTEARLRELHASCRYVRRIGDQLISDPDPLTATHMIVIRSTCVVLRRLRTMRQQDHSKPAGDPKHHILRRVHPSNLKGWNGKGLPPLPG